MDLKKARSPIEEERREEEQRFRSSVDALKSQNKLKLLITDSQAMDVVHKWTMEPGTAAPSDQGGQNSQETVPLTTFSVMMINYMSGGRLSAFVEGIKRFEALKRGDKVLICEACNHDRFAFITPAAPCLVSGVLTFCGPESRTISARCRSRPS